MVKQCFGRRICPISSSAPRPLGAAYVPILLSEVEQEQRLSGNGDRGAIVVGAGLCDGNKTFRQKKIRDVSANFSSRNVPYYLGFVFGFLQTGPNQFVGNQKRNQDNIPVCRILEMKKNDKINFAGMMQSKKRASDMSSFPLVPRGPLGPLIFPSC